MTLPAQDVPVLTNLPAPITPLIGRHTEIQTLDHLLGERETRIITVLAPGGMGKTLLALEVARQQLQRFADGVYFITVTESISTEHLASLIADVMHWQYAPGRDMQRQLLDFLQQRELLLLIDNAEFAIDAAPYLTAILASAPAVKILATSRVKLNLYTETPFPLAGLAHSAETKDEAAEIEAVELFAQRAKNVRPDFQLTPQSRLAIEEICRLTQGMPLALVLAASWMALLSPEEIAREIRRGFNILETDFRDVPERQRSIRAIFDFTWGLLEKAEQRVFARLSVFRQGFSVEAAQMIAQGSLHSLRGLLKTAVLQPTPRERRFEVHELLRQYAAEHLHSSDELDATAAAHSQYFLEFIRDRSEYIKDHRQLEALDAFQADEENIRAAWEWAVQHDQQVYLSEALEGLFWYCVMRSRYPLFEALWDFTRKSFTLMSVPNAHLLLARMQLRFRWIQRWQEGSFIHHPAVLEELEALLTLFGDFDAPLEIALCTLTLGDALRTLTDDLERATDLHQSAAQAFRILGDEFYTAWAFHFHAKLMSDTQGIGVGIDLLNQGLVLRRKHGDQIGTAYSLYNLSMDLLPMGKLEECARVTEEILSISRVTGEPSTLLLAQITRTLLAFLAGRFDEARQQNAINQRLARSLNHVLGLAWVNLAQSLLDYLDGEAENAIRALANSESLATQAVVRYFVHLGYALMLHDDEVMFKRHLFSAMSQANEFAAFGAQAWCLPPLAAWEAQHGQPVRAAELLGLAKIQAGNLMGWLPQWLTQTTLQTQLEQHLDAEAFETAYERGRRLDVAQIIRSFLSANTSQKSSDSSIPAHTQEANQRLFEPLSDRELEVIAYIGRGFSNREIASELVVELSTVKKHLTHIYDKLDVDTRTQAILRAQELRLT